VICQLARDFEGPGVSVISGNDAARARGTPRIRMRVAVALAWLAGIGYFPGRQLQHRMDDRATGCIEELVARDPALLDEGRHGRRDPLVPERKSAKFRFLAFPAC